MRLKVLLIFFMTIHNIANSQVSDEQAILELSKFYRTHFFTSKPNRAEFDTLGQDFPKKYDFIKNFLFENSYDKNKLLSDQFLVCPDMFSLKVVYILDALFQNPGRVNPRPENILIDSLLNSDINKYEMLDEYYSTILTTIGNKNRDAIHHYNFDLNKLLPNDTLAQSVLFLRSMDECRKLIFGYMILSDQPMFKQASKEIAKYPTFNGLPYYKFNNFNGTDFKLEIFNDQGVKGYYETYISNYYTLLFQHLMCVYNLSKKPEDFYDLWNNSLLSDEKYYVYSPDWIKTELIRITEEIKAQH